MGEDGPTALSVEALAFASMIGDVIDAKSVNPRSGNVTMTPRLKMKIRLLVAASLLSTSECHEHAQVIH